MFCIRNKIFLFLREYYIIGSINRVAQEIQIASDYNTRNYEKAWIYLEFTWLFLFLPEGNVSLLETRLYRCF